MKKINDFLAGIPMTIVGGVFLVLSLVLSRVGIVLSENRLMAINGC